MVGILKKYCSIFIPLAYFSGISTFNKYFIQWSMILYFLDFIVFLLITVSVRRDEDKKENYDEESGVGVNHYSKE